MNNPMRGLAALVVKSLWRAGALVTLLSALTAPVGAAGTTGGKTAPLPLAATAISRCDLKWWCNRHQAVLETLRQTKPEVIFLGDSITYNWERSGPEPWADYQAGWQRFFGAWRPVNLGFIGDTTASVLWRITHGEIDHIAPKAVVLLIGANNFGRVHWSAEATEAGIAAIIATLRQRLPDAHILLLSVLPSDRGPWVNTMTRAINDKLKARYGMATVAGVHYLDVSGLFLINGTIDQSRYYDPLLSPPQPALHPTAEAQEKIAAAIQPLLQQWLAAPTAAP